MKSRFRYKQSVSAQSGLSMVELLIAMALSATVMSGVVSVLLVSKNNFISERELASLQENARFAIKFLGDEIKMAGFSGCNSNPLEMANTVDDTTGSWYLNNTGIQGYEHETPLSFPASPNNFSGIRAGTDAIVVRRAINGGLQVDSHNPTSARFSVNKPHDLVDGQIMVVARPDCQQVGIFQVSNANLSNVNIVHNTGAAVTPGNCTKVLTGNFDCTNPPSNPNAGQSYPPGSKVLTMSSQAFYIGTSASGNNIPALFSRGLGVTGSLSAAQELVLGIENMQILYGVDTSGNDDVADIYLKADAAAMDWDQVVSVRLFLRMRSINPIYNRDEPFGEFQGISGTDGSDRFMRQVVTTTIQLRN